MEVLQADVEKELRLVNSIIREAISHGGDLGGSYSTNGENLNNVIMAYLRARNLDNQYTRYHHHLKLLFRIVFQQ